MAATSTVVDAVQLATFTMNPIKSRTAFHTVVLALKAKVLNFWRREGRRGGTLPVALKD